MYLSGTEALDTGMKAALGVFVHGLAGDLAEDALGKRGMTARDIIRFLPEILKR